MRSRKRIVRRLRFRRFTRSFGDGESSYLGSLRAMGGSSPKVRAANMAKARIVVVEDEPAIRRGVVDVLRASGYDLAEAADGERGLQEAVRVGVDLVLLDLLMPKMDGLQVLTELRKIRPSLPVIILTAKGTEDDRVRGLKMGADDYVV